MNRSARRIAIANMKGGSGKTTTAVNLSATLALRGEKTLLVDIDPKAGASISLGVDISAAGSTIYELLLGMESDPGKAIVATKARGLDMIPSAPRLAGAEMELAALPGRERRLAETLYPLGSRYSYVIVDCPSQMGLLTLNALAACDEVMAPVQPHYLSVAAVDQMSDIIKKVRERINPRLRLTGLIPAMCDHRKKVTKLMMDRMEKKYGKDIFRPGIRADTKLAEAPAKGKPVHLSAPKSNGAYDYAVLTDDVRVM